MANGAELPLDFCGTLLGIIQRLRPGKAGAAAPAAAAAAAPGSTAKYPALAVPDSRDRAAELNKELLGGRNPLLNVACVPSAARAAARSAAPCVRLAAPAALPACDLVPRHDTTLTRRACACSDDPRFLEERQPAQRREERCDAAANPRLCCLLAGVASPTQPPAHAARVLTLQGLWAG